MTPGGQFLASLLATLSVPGLCCWFDSPVPLAFPGLPLVGLTMYLGFRWDWLADVTEGESDGN